MPKTIKKRKAAAKKRRVSGAAPVPPAKKRRVSGTTSSAASAIGRVVIERVSVHLIDAAPYNPRKDLRPGDPEYRKLHRSIKTFGYVDPLVVNKRREGRKTRYRLVGGHQRLKILVDEFGAKHVDVTVVHLDDDNERALNVALNRIEGAWDDVRLAELLIEMQTADGVDETLTGFDAEEIGLVIAAAEDALDSESLPGDTDIDAIPEPPEQVITRPGDLITMGKHRLLCGDSVRQEHVDKLLDGRAIDLVCTDPPYCSGGFQELARSSGSVGTDAKHKQIANDRLSSRGFSSLTKSAIGNIGAPYLYQFTDWRMWLSAFDVAESLGLGVRSMIVWDKGHPGMGRGWRAQHELILWACKKVAPYDKHWSGKGNVIAIGRTGNKHHTTEKPVDLIVQLLSNTPFAKTVADPFCGSGTMLVASEMTKRTCYAMEMDPAYCDVIVQRWEDFTGDKAVRSVDV